MELGQRQADKATLRQHLLRLQASTGRTDPRLVSSVPAAGRSLWDVFGALSRARASNGFGPSAIGPRDVQAWCDLHGVRLTAWELDTLDAMDAALLSAVSAQEQGSPN